MMGNNARVAETISGGESASRQIKDVRRSQVMEEAEMLERAVDELEKALDVHLGRLVMISVPVEQVYPPGAADSGPIRTGSPLTVRLENLVSRVCRIRVTLEEADTRLEV